MVNAQDWLNAQEWCNTKAKRATVEELYITEQLEGESDLGEFTHVDYWDSGVKVYLYPDIDNSKLTFINQGKNVKIIKLIPAQAWLDKNYPRKGTCQIKKDRWGSSENYGRIRAQITELNISDKNLTGELKLTGFTNLTTLYCSDNNLTNLDFLTQLNPKQLTNLDIRNNNFPNHDLTIFSQFTNLKGLYIGSNKQDGINQDSYNRWHGSLVPLQKLTKLTWLDISNTDINNGLEYLPDSLAEFYCATKQRPNSLSQELGVALTVYGEPSWNSNYISLLQQWKWKQAGFTEQESKQWIKTGLEVSEYNYAIYLQKLGYTLTTPNLATIIKDAPTYLKGNYPLSEREQIKELNLDNKQLTGELNLTSFVNLEILDCSYNQLTHLDLSQCDNLKTLDISNTNFISSLEYFKNLTNLVELDISDTNIITGLEYLPDSLATFNCQGTKLGWELAPYDGDDIEKLTSWKKHYFTWKEQGFSKEEFNQWKDLGLNLDEYQTALYLKEENISFEQFKEDFQPYHGDYQLWKTNYSETKLLKEEVLNFLLLKVKFRDVTNLIKEQKDKIINAYTHFFTEKELLRKLITAI